MFASTLRWDMMEHVSSSWFLIWCDTLSPSFNLYIFGLRTRVFASISRSSSESVILEFAKRRFTSSRLAIRRGCWWDVEECFAPPLSRLMMEWECPKLWDHFKLSLPVVSFSLLLQNLTGSWARTTHFDFKTNENLRKMSKVYSNYDFWKTCPKGGRGDQVKESAARH